MICQFFLGSFQHYSDRQIVPGTEHHMHGLMYTPHIVQLLYLISGPGLGFGMLHLVDLPFLLGRCI